MILIDPPTPFDTLATWQVFLAEMETLAKDHPDDDDVQAQIVEARNMIESRAS